MNCAFSQHIDHRVAALLLCVAIYATKPASADEPLISFNRDVRPILSDQCFFCHGPDPSRREADLRLDVEANAKDYAIVEGEPTDSELIARITSDDPDERMPPPDSGKNLNGEAIELLTNWIQQGARYEPYWAFATPKRHPAPKTQNHDWAAGWIDQFILARLESEHLAPSKDADRTTLIRRLSFDLNGLPPTPEETAAFLSDESPGAYEKVVERLLASQRYGERMAMYWLDLVRYADTVGYHGDQDHNISPYRDFVIEAFNDNLAFDQFTVEQLAGDLLPDAGVDQKIATGYNRLLQTSHEGGVQPKEYLAIYAADRVRNFSNVWLAATMGCSQCHDHKYDPYTTKDFYSLVAFFADVDEAQHFKTGSNSLPTARPPEIEVLSERERQRVAQLQQRIAAIENKVPTLAPNMAEDLEALKKELQQIRDGARKTMITKAIEPRTIRVLPRGNWLDDSGEIVLPAIPAFLGNLEVGDRRATRHDLARWLTNTQDGVGGLTSRVFVNRLWYLLFGTGIVNTLDDFGGQGEPPIHPKLLDTLAVEFYEHDWDVKHMVKLIVMSRAYRQSSLESPELRDRDPDNRLYARQSRFRLPAEMVRDNALAISGLLVEEVGGASVKPYQPAGYYRHLNFPQRRYEHHTDRRQWRRGIYVHWQRQFLHPMLKALDAPGREECTAQRPRSNTPLAALALLNDPTFIEAARVFATRIVQQSVHDDRQRLEFAFLNAVSRPPDQFEESLLLDLLNEHRQQYAAHTELAQLVTSTGLAALPEDIDEVELAAWTAVARAILNMNETITRN